MRDRLTSLLTWLLPLLAIAVLGGAVAAYGVLPLRHGSYLAQVATAAGTVGLALVTVAVLLDNRRLARSGADQARSQEYLAWEPYLRVESKAGGGGLPEAPEARWWESVTLRNIGNGPALGVVFLCLREEWPGAWFRYEYGPIDLAAGESFGEGPGTEWGSPITIEGVREDPPPLDPAHLPMSRLGNPPRATYRTIVCRDRFGRRLRFEPTLSAAPKIKDAGGALDDVDRWYDSKLKSRVF